MRVRGGVGVEALGVHDGHAVLEGLGERPAHLLLPDGDDEDPLGPVQALHDKVHRLEGGHVGDDGVEGEDPAPKDHAADDVEDDVVDHHEGAHRQAQPLGEDDRHDLDAVHGAAVADGQAAAQTGDETAEEGAEQQIGACQGRGHGHVHGEDVGDRPGPQGVDGHRIHGVHREDRPLPPQPVEKEGGVEEEEEDGEGPALRGELGEQHGGPRDAAVIELDGGQEDGNTKGIDQPRRRQKEEVGGGEPPQLPEKFGSFFHGSRSHPGLIRVPDRPGPIFMELRGCRRANKPILSLFSRYYHITPRPPPPTAGDGILVLFFLVSSHQFVIK